MSLRIASLAVVLALLAGCGTVKNKSSELDNTLETYAAVIRWGNFEDAVGFIDPEVLKLHPVTTLDLERYHQVRVTVYSEQPVQRAGENEVRQLVEIGLVNNNTLAARAIIDRQLWRYDEAKKRWWLMSGLPDITTH
jgi:hypothetical protein